MKVTEPAHTPLTIRCAKCKKPVDETIVQQSPFELTYRYVVTCHGEVEECKVDVEVLYVAGLRVIEAVAFRDKPSLPDASPAAVPSCRE